MNKKILIWLSIIIAFFAVAYIGISVYIAVQLTKSVPSPLKDSPTVISENFENIEFVTSDNFKLKGWLFKNPTSENLIIFVNGTNQNRTDADYKTLDIAKEAYDLGYSVLLFDRRTTGESDGKRITFGLPERLDIIEAVNFAQKKGYKQENIGIIANSIGSVSTLMAITELQDVGAIVLDSPAARIKPVVEYILKNEQHIPDFLNPGIFTAAMLLFHAELDKIQPLEEVKKVPNREFLYLHGENDTVIFKENSEELLKNSNPESRLVIFPGAKHVQTYTSNPELYRTEVFGFLEEQFNK